MTASSEGWFLGLDSSTQSLKASVVDARLTVVAEFLVNFDADLPEFKTQGGVHRGADGLTVTSPPVLWVAALDLLLGRMQKAGFDFGRVRAVSGSGQQHGSVYWARGAEALLRGLRPEATLREQLGGAFAVEASPIWMDSSTTAQCRERETALGGAQAVAELTGSRAYERFTGNQIAKVFQTRPEAYAATERISLVSSFVACLLIGQYAPIDTADGAGMNLMDLRRKAWAPAALKVTAPDLDRRLGPIVPGHTQVGTLHRYFVARYGFSPSCRVLACSGDNPCSLAGLRLQKPGDIAISLGTSDTVFGALSDPRPSASEGHLFANPVDPAGYMALVCYKNGSLTREDVRDRCAGGTWAGFSAALRDTVPGNEGQLGFFIKEPEITPPILTTGVHRFDAQGRPAGGFAAAVEVRAVVEGQFLSMRLHGANVGIRPAGILATGGASANEAILRVMADVFGVPVFTGEQPNSAALGAAYRALHGWHCAVAGAFVPFAEIMRGAPPFKRAMDPDPKAHAVYTALLPRYAELERRIAG